jgi:hypothetical protein
MRLELRTRRDTPRLAALMARLAERTQAGITALALDHVERAQRRSRIETGAQRASVYAIVRNGLDQSSAALAAAQRLRPQAQVFPVREPPPRQGPAGASAVVACGVEYGIFNDRGHHGWPGDGWWSQTVAETRSRARGYMREVVNV